MVVIFLRSKYTGKRKFLNDLNNSKKKLIFSSSNNVKFHSKYFIIKHYFILHFFNIEMKSNSYLTFFLYI